MDDVVQLSLGAIGSDLVVDHQWFRSSLEGYQRDRRGWLLYFVEEL